MQETPKRLTQGVELPATGDLRGSVVTGSHELSVGQGMGAGVIQERDKGPFVFVIFYF